MFSPTRCRNSRLSSSRRRRQAKLGRAALRFFALRLEALEPRLVLDGASLVLDLLPGPDSSHPFAVGTLGDTLYFSASNADGTRSLWTVTGSQNPTLLANNEANGRGIEFDEELYFSASDSEHGFELWRTDGTESGTQMVKDIRQGSFSSFPGQEFAVLGGELYFTAFHDDFGTELWKTDGTEEGTVLVKDILPGTAGSDPREVVVAGGLVFFSANDGTSGREVWRSDGTEAGTSLTKDVFPGSGNSFRPEELTALGNVVYFRHGNLSTGEELWKTDGSETGTVIVKDIYPGQTCRPAFCFFNHSRPDEITAIGDLLYFSADSATGRELYKSDGTEDGTVLVRDIYPGTDGIEPYRSNPTDFTALGDFVYFFTEHFDQFGQSELWKTDGTEIGTVRVKDLNPVESANAFRLTAIGQSLYFVACGDVTGGDDGGDPANCEPWVSDGTEAGTRILHDINPGLANSSPQGDFVAGGGTVFFNADDGEHGAELWRTGLAVQSGADLEVSIGDSPDPVLIGQPLTYTIIVTNHGPEDATGVVATASAPGSADFSSVMVPLGTVPVGESRSFQIEFAPTTEGTFSVVASVIGAEGDPNEINNSDAESTLVQKPVPPITIELASATLEVSESQTEAVLIVTRTGPLSSGTSSIEFTTVGGTAGQRGILAGLTRTDDFTTTSGTLFFRPRSNTATIRVPIRDDAAIEGDENFKVVLSNPSENAKLGPIASTTITLHDNDPSISFVASSSDKAEVGGRGVISPIAVVLSNPLNQTVTVGYTVVGGSAMFGQDFRPQSGTITFRPRETSKAIPLEILHDMLFEGDETVTFELTNPVGAFLGAKTRHRVTIIDNDPKPPPVDPGSTPQTALEIDLATLPRQSYEQFLSAADVDTFMVKLGANERLALDVDPFGPGTALPSSVLKISDEAGNNLSTVGTSAEPEGGSVTNNPATLFRADADGGTYFIRLSTTAAGRAYGYSLRFHRIGVAEEVPHPDLLNVSGPMYAWFDGDRTVGITGPTGYGFTLVAEESSDWEQQVNVTPRTALRSQTLKLNVGSQFTLRSPNGVELPLIANEAITISTKTQRWGDVFGVVKTSAINFPVSLSIVPINNLLAEVFGSEIVAIGALTGQWRISLGGETRFRFGRNEKAPVEQMLAGVPYLRHVGSLSALTAQVGEFTLGDAPTTGTEPIDWIFDPADPMLYIRIDKELGALKNPGLAISMHGLLEYKPNDEPNPEIDAGVTEIFGHVFAVGKFKFKLGPAPMEVEAANVFNLDADRDGQFLAGLATADDLRDIITGDFSQFRDILNDVQFGSNGRLDMVLDLKATEVAFDLGNTSVVVNGLEETIWVRAEQENPLDGTPLEDLVVSVTGVFEGMVNWDGDFLFAVTADYGLFGADLIFDLVITQEGISAQLTGRIEWSATIDYLAGTVSGKAIAEISGRVEIDFDDLGHPSLSGSISASGKLTAKIAGDNKKLFEGSIDALVRKPGFRFKFPRGVGSLDLDIFV
jgi:uncharacterized repeat protein (TIGR01451 family)